MHACMITRTHVISSAIDVVPRFSCRLLAAARNLAHQNRGLSSAAAGGGGHGGGVSSKVRPADETKAKGLAYRFFVVVEDHWLVIHK